MEYQELSDLVDDYLCGGANVSYSTVVREITDAQEAGTITDGQAANLFCTLEDLG